MNTVLVTGGSRGLGRAICARFAQTGAKVAFTWTRDEEGAAQTRAAAEQAGAAEVRDFRVSVTDAVGTRRMLDELEGAWDGLDVLVNNAGITQTLPLPLISEEDWDRIMDVNVKGTWLTSKAALRGMIRRRRGVIVNLGSLVGGRMIDAPVHYCTSKAAVEGLTRALALQVARHGIRVVCVAPGLLEDGVAKTLPPHRMDAYLDHCSLSRVGRFDEVADVVAFLSSAGSSFVTGSTVVVAGGV